MSPGKSMAQAGHAYLEAFRRAMESPEHQKRLSTYTSDPPGTKICLLSRNGEELQMLHAHALDIGIPGFLVIDSGHVELPDFTGSPVLTALGIGPVTREEARDLGLNRLPLWPGRSRAPPA
jgi:PTH2 family peptidyl-tRNA hydrolase